MDRLMNMCIGNDKCSNNNNNNSNSDDSRNDNNNNNNNNDNSNDDNNGNKITDLIIIITNFTLNRTALNILVPRHASFTHIKKIINK